MTGAPNSDETFITITQAMRDVKVDAGPATGMRWSRNGLAGPDGQRIFLQTWAIGRQIMTTRAAMLEFIEKVTAARAHKVQARSHGNGGDATFALRGQSFKAVDLGRLGNRDGRAGLGRLVRPAREALHLVVHQVDAGATAEGEQRGGRGEQPEAPQERMGRHGSLLNGMAAA